MIHKLETEMKRNSLHRCHNSIAVVLYFLFIAIFLFSCAYTQIKIPQKDSLFYFSDFVMGVQVEMTLRSSDIALASEAAEDAFREMKRLDNKLSNWKEESEISKINKASPTEWIPVSDEMFEVLSEGLKLSESTNGAFDMTVGKLLRLWNFYSGEPSLPPEEKQKEAMQYVGYKLVELDREKKMLRFRKNGVEIDLGGIAKGYILRKGHKLLRKEGIASGLINGAGDIYVWGKKPDKSLWNIAVHDPMNPDIPLTILPVTDEAIFTSGDYERKFKKEGKVFHHIFDPRTGTSATGCHGVTIITENIEGSNGLSSSVFILGPEQGKAFIDKLQDTEAIIFSSDGKVILSENFRKKFPDLSFSR